MLEGSRVLVVIPAYDAEEHVARVTETLPPFVDHAIVVDDGSRDGTRARALLAASRETRFPVDVISHGVNRGVGAAIVTGYEAALAKSTAPCDALVVMAGDGQMDPADLERLVLPIARGAADYVKGDRFIHPEARAMPRDRYAAGRVLSVLTSLAIGVTVHDTQCGYTALARHAALALPLGALWLRYGYPNDLLGQVARAGLRIHEVPVRPVYEGAKSGLHAGYVPRIVGIVLRAGWRRLRARARARSAQKHQVVA